MSMRRTHNADGTISEVDDNGLETLRAADGSVIRAKVPLMMRDSMRAGALHDGVGGGALGLHRPGFRVSDAADERQATYDQYDKRATNAWRGEPDDDEEDDADELRDALLDAALATTDARAAAYFEYDALLRDAWRRP